MNELVDMTYDIPSDAIDCACITFKLKNELVDGLPTETTHYVNIAKPDIKILLKEMKTVRSLMDETEWKLFDFASHATDSPEQTWHL